MAEPLTNLDLLLLDRWADTTGIRDAIKELEERLGARLKAAGERLRPWLEGQGFTLLDVETKYAGVKIGKSQWMENKEDPLIHIYMGGLLPFGYRRVDDEHPYVWLIADSLSEKEQEVFQADLSARLKDRPGEWLNEHCDLDWPVGRYVESYGDLERARLVQSEDAFESFMKAELEPLLAMGGDIDAALLAARGGRPSKVKG